MELTIRLTFLYVIVGFPLVAVTAFGQAAPSSGFQFSLEIANPNPVGSGARALGLGNAFIAVADDAIGAVVEEIQSDLHIGQYVLHVSGRHGLQVLASVRAQGALPLAVHPVMTFTGTSLDLDRLEDCPFAVTARSEERL